jgi:hypothetical protein
MSTTPNKADEQDAPASIPQITPRGIGYGHPEYQFMQTALELQKSIIELTATVNGMKITVDSVKTKVDDLVNWKSLIVGGAITLGFLIGLGFTIMKTMDNVTVSFGKNEAAEQLTKK